MGKNIFWRFLFLLYCGVMLWLLFGRSNGYIAGIPYETQLRDNTNLIPLFTIKNYLTVLEHSTNKALLTHCFSIWWEMCCCLFPQGGCFPKYGGKCGISSGFSPCARD